MRLLSHGKKGPSGTSSKRNESDSCSASTAASLRRSDTGSTSNAQSVADSPVDSSGPHGSLQRLSAGTPHSQPSHGQLSVSRDCVGPCDLPEHLLAESPPKQVPPAVRPFKVLSASSSQGGPFSRQGSQERTAIVSLGDLPDWLREAPLSPISPLPENIKDIMALDAPAEDAESIQRRYRRFRRSSSSRSSGSRSFARSFSSISGVSDGPLSPCQHILKRNSTKGSGDGSLISDTSSHGKADAAFRRSGTKASSDSMLSEMSTQGKFGSSRTSSVGGSSAGSNEDADRHNIHSSLRRSTTKESAATSSDRPSNGRVSIRDDAHAEEGSTSDGRSEPLSPLSPSSPFSPFIPTPRRRLSARSSNRRGRSNDSLDASDNPASGTACVGFDSQTSGMSHASSSPAQGFGSSRSSNPSLRRSKSEAVRTAPTSRISLRRAQTESPGRRDLDSPMFASQGGFGNRCEPLPELAESEEFDSCEDRLHDGWPRGPSVAQKASDSRNSQRKQTPLRTMLGKLRASMGGKPENVASDGKSLASPDRAVIILDWDDTLLPTSFIKQVVVPGLDEDDRDGPVPPESHFFSELRLHAGVVEEILRAASQVARVAIVTLATRWWVHISAERYLPGLDLNLLLQELNLTVYPADRQSAMVKALAMSGRDPCKVAKKNAMLKCLKKLYYGIECPWNVISIGDSTIEQEAIKECVSGTAKQKSLCKTVKLPESMSLAELRSELQQLVPVLQRLVSYGKDFDRNSNNLERFGLGPAGRLIRI